MPDVIGILQPMYLPWPGFFEQIATADHFVLMDDVQYTRRDWRNRNRIKSATGPQWITVPIKHPSGARISEIEIDYRRDWIRKHERSIEVNYRRRPYFQPLYDELRAVLHMRPDLLADLNERIIRLLMRHLDVDTPLSLASAIPRNPAHYGCGVDARNERILEICQHHRASVLYDGKSAEKFIDLERFQSAGIDVVFQDYRFVTYPQAFGEFVPSLSTLDLVMNTGPDAGRLMRSGGAGHLLSPRPRCEHP